jgi:hypothetical protein
VLSRNDGDEMADSIDASADIAGLSKRPCPDIDSLPGCIGNFLHKGIFH